VKWGCSTFIPGQEVNSWLFLPYSFHWGLQTNRRRHKAAFIFLMATRIERIRRICADQII
jgi:hypothetical protein